MPHLLWCGISFFAITYNKLNLNKFYENQNFTNLIFCKIN